MSLDIHIDYFGGMTPVQCWGSLSGRGFYFRARWDYWSFQVGEDGLLPVVSDEDERDLDFLLESSYGDGAYDAGYMPFEDSRRIIADCIARYAADICGEDYDLTRAEVTTWFDRWIDTYPDYELAGPGTSPS